MKAILLSLTLLCASLFASAESDNPHVIMHTNRGDITIELFPEQAPVTVDNFLHYVRSGFYNGTIFHRVIPRFVIQGGGFTPDMMRKATRDPIVNEADKRLPHPVHGAYQ